MHTSTSGREQQQHPDCAAQQQQAHLQPQPQQQDQQQQRGARRWLRVAAGALGLACALYLGAPHAAKALESLPPAAIALFREFLAQIDALGPWGAVLFVGTVMLAEMVPLFPTQPLTLASGLLFGPVKGAALVVLGCTLAAVNAYSLSKGIGRQLAEKVIAHEVGEEEGPMQRQLAAVTRAIERGGFVRQVTAITLLRLTPVIPYSASNYLLGLTPVQLAPLVIGTAAGMSVWSLLYASLGGASKALLESGADLETLLAEMVEKAGHYADSVAIAGLTLVLVVGGGFFISSRVLPGLQPRAAGAAVAPQPPVPGPSRDDPALQQK